MKYRIDPFLFQSLKVLQIWSSVKKPPNPKDIHKWLISIAYFL